jgi:ADP-ribose pyrophosphatase
MSKPNSCVTFLKKRCRNYCTRNALSRFFRSIYTVFAIACLTVDERRSTREIFERGHAAVLLPFDPVRDEVVLVEQIRIAAYDTSESPWLLEMVAGMIEEGETVEDVARREALEEAGLKWGGKKVLSYLASPAAPASAYPYWWAKWMPRRQKGFTVWPMKTKIFGFMW